MALAGEQQKGRGAHHVVYHSWILAVRDVVHAQPGRPPVMVEIEFALHGNIQSEVIGKAKLAWPGYQLAKLVDGEERKTGPPDGGVSDVKLLQLPKQRHRSPRDQLIRRVPRQGSSSLCASN